MDIAFHIIKELHFIFKQAAALSSHFGDDFDPDIRLSDPKFADFQVNGILAYAQKNKTNPRQLAQVLLETLERASATHALQFDKKSTTHSSINDYNDSNQDFFSQSLLTQKEYTSMSVAGPGFINIQLSPKCLYEWLLMYRDKHAFQKSAALFYKGKTIVIDYSSPNTAKQMHVGHLRSMNIGESIQRLLRFAGAHVIRDNHIGDWGTQFGMLIMAIKQSHYDLDAPHSDLLEELEALYKEAQAAFKKSPEAQVESRQELLRLQQGDPENMQIWEKINQLSYKAFQEIYDLFNIEFDVILGESFYRDKVESICEELFELGIACESDGALVVFHEEPHSNTPYPFIIRKQDGASNYATTDLAAAYHRTQILKADEMINVTDGRQQDHFKYLARTTERWFSAKKLAHPVFKHVWFGSILGEDGKAIKTRSGNPLKLKEIVQEGISRAMQIVEAKNPNLSDSEKNHIARVVAIGAIRYADLAQNRTLDYVFSWEKLLSFDGNTAPYLLYAVARIHSIFRKLDLQPHDISSETHASLLETPSELALAQKLVSFPIIIDQALSELRPHFICHYLFELAGLFSSFYKMDKVIHEDPSIQARRLLLCSRTLSVLEMGLHLLGLETLQRM